MEKKGIKGFCVAFIVILLLSIVSGCSTVDPYTEIMVDGGDLSGSREANVKVDVGFGDRLYWAYTNAYGQLVEVTADEITLQNSKTEAVNSNGRYYSDEAKVPGTESPDLDEGHVIADSLGGVSNAYNICPQESHLNRYGDQAYMEKAIREALYDGGSCTDFTAIITYPDTSTQTPDHYDFTYTLNGNVIHDSFDNANPEESDVESTTESQTSAEGDVSIQALDKKAEYIVLENESDEAIELEGWVIVSEKGNQRYTFSDYTLQADQTVSVGDPDRSDVDLDWGTSNVWNNTKSDNAKVYNAQGALMATMNN